jgi:hypothetical protein
LKEVKEITTNAAECLFLLLGIGLRFSGISMLLYFVFLREEKPVLRPKQTWHKKDFADDRHGK